MWPSLNLVATPKTDSKADDKQIKWLSWIKYFNCNIILESLLLVAFSLNDMDFWDAYFAIEQS